MDFTYFGKIVQIYSYFLKLEKNWNTEIFVNTEIIVPTGRYKSKKVNHKLCSIFHKFSFDTNVIGLALLLRPKHHLEV